MSQKTQQNRPDYYRAGHVRLCLHRSLPGFFLKLAPVLSPACLPQEPPKDGRLTCVYWEDRGGMQQWSTEGCVTLSSVRNHTACSCSHLSTFAVILQTGKVQVGVPGRAWGTWGSPLNAIFILLGGRRWRGLYTGLAEPDLHGCGLGLPEPGCSQLPLLQLEPQGEQHGAPSPQPEPPPGTPALLAGHKPHAEPGEDTSRQAKVCLPCFRGVRKGPQASRGLCVNDNGGILILSYRTALPFSFGLSYYITVILHCSVIHFV